MEEAEIRAVLTVAVTAALADGLRDEAERASLKALAARVDDGRVDDGRVDLVAVYEDVLARRPTIAEAVAPLTSPDARRTAYEAAAAMVAADGMRTPPEAAFLEELATALGLPAEEARSYAAEADAIAAAGLGAGGKDAGAETGSPTAEGPGVGVGARAAGTEPDPGAAQSRPKAGGAGSPAGGALESPGAGQNRPEASDTREARMRASPAELEQRILDAALTNAALELLPNSLASMAILPLQARLVYRIGQAHGYELDQGHVRELAATLGIGLTGQYLEQFGRKLLGGLLGGVLGGVGRAVGRQAASSGMAFATTWALGQVARQYYAGGRRLDAAKLRAAFAPLLEQGQGLVARYAPEIQRRAAGIDLGKLPALVGRA